MRCYYFKDSDTLVFKFSKERVADYIDLDFQTLLELDCEGMPVAITIEHARKRDVPIEAGQVVVSYIEEDVAAD